MPDLDDLDHFDQGLPVLNPLPPSEVRRRGDRLRRRRTAAAAVGGVLAAAIAIGTPVVALSGGNGERGDEPAPRPTATQAPTEPPGGWLTTIPEDFPLTSGFPDPAAEPHDQLAQDPSVLAVCGGEGFAGFVDNAVVTFRGESEDSSLRILAVYPDATAAAAELAEVRRSVAGCLPQPLAEGTSTVVDAVPVDLGTEESFAFSQQVRFDDGLVSDLSLFLLGRTGNAIYVDMAYTAAGGDQVVAIERDRLEERSAAPLSAMCVFAAEPCAGPG